MHGTKRERHLIDIMLQITLKDSLKSISIVTQYCRTYFNPILSTLTSIQLLQSFDPSVAIP